MVVEVSRLFKGINNKGTVATINLELQCKTVEFENATCINSASIS
jgi:hypothetical protein